MNLKSYLKKKVTQLALLIANPYTFAIVTLATIIWVCYIAIFGLTDHIYRITEMVLSFATFLTVFIVQFSEEADTSAIQIKLDEIIKADEKIDQSVVGKELELKNVAEEVSE